MIPGIIFCQNDDLPLEIPEIKKNEGLIRHKYYSLVYNEDAEIAKWTAYSLSKKEIEKKTGRISYYKKDNSVKTETAVSSDYTNSGYDRGHLVPARDMMFNKLAQDEVRLMSNISPQAPSFNRDIWKKLESKVRDWSIKYDSVLVVCGPVPGEGLGWIEKSNKIKIPSAYFKAVLVYNEQEKSAIGFIIPNSNDIDSSLLDFSMKINKLEKKIGRNLYPEMNWWHQLWVEIKVETDFWNLKTD